MYLRLPPLQLHTTPTPSDLATPTSTNIVATGTITPLDSIDYFGDTVIINGTPVVDAPDGTKDNQGLHLGETPGTPAAPGQGNPGNVNQPDKPAKPDKPPKPEKPPKPTKPPKK